MNCKRTNILGYDVVRCDITNLVDHLEATIAEKDHPKWLACLNPHSYSVALGDPEFEMALKNADWLIPDGFGIVLGGLILGRPRFNRVTGSDVFNHLMCRLNTNGKYKVFFLGSSIDNLGLVEKQFRSDFRNLEFVGGFSPAFKAEFSSEEIDEMVDVINRARPDILWVGMTAPKQEVWLFRNLQRLHTVRFAAGIGAVFDFYTGNVRRPGALFQKLGLEWFPRLVREPNRLWQRMLISAPNFMAAILRAFFRSMCKRT